ncbi:MAG: glycosyltransferase family 2 protein [Deltaproteobacteria bacterium]|nr:glycosyltransferase family 2 protein [Deltaproteobacteria bacterium]
MQVTALIPVRDGASTLSVALESLRNQTHPIYSCVVVDDGSTDSTPRLLDEWRGRWSALRVARTDGLGIARALNAGLSLSASEWIARLDADDRAHPARVERQLAAAAADSALLVGCSVRHWVEGARADAYEGMRRHVDWANARASHEELERALWVDSPLAHPSWLVHRRAFEAVGEYDESGAVPEDYDWLHRFFAASRSAGELRATKAAGEPLVDWAESDTRLTRVSSAYSEAVFGDRRGAPAPHRHPLPGHRGSRSRPLARSRRARARPVRRHLPRHPRVSRQRRAALRRGRARAAQGLRFALSATGCARRPSDRRDGDSSRRWTSRTREAPR